MPVVRHGFGLRSRVVAWLAACTAAPAAIVFAATTGSAPVDRELAIAAAALLGLAGTLAAAWGVDRLVLRRVRAMLAATARLHAGDLSARTGVPHGGTEIGALAGAFDRMAASLEQQQHERVLADEQLRLSEARKSAVLEASFDGILVLDGLGAVRECNAAARAMFGCNGRRCVHHRLSELFPLELPFESSRFNRPAEAFETTGRRLDQSDFPAEMSIAPIRDPAARGLFVATVRDITARKQLEHSLEDLSFRDDLTGLCNRRGFLMFASQQMKIAARNGHSVLLVAIDLDGLKAINDQFGHANGDRALLELARALVASFRETDVIGRLGGDEFVVLATESEQRGAEHALERLAMRIANRNAHGDLPWVLSASMGWLRAEPAQGVSLGALLEQVDERMYADKRRPAPPPPPWLANLLPAREASVRPALPAPLTSPPGPSPSPALPAGHATTGAERSA